MLGITKRIDQVGRVVIPKEFREKLGLHPGMIVVVNLVGNSITISLLPTEGCTFCGRRGEVRVGKTFVCNECFEKSKKLFEEEGDTPELVNDENNEDLEEDAFFEGLY